MLYCELCNYFQPQAGKNGAFSQCEFTGVTFAGKGALQAEEYPCRHATMEQYEARLARKREIARLSGGEWRVAYRRVHLVSGAARLKVGLAG